MQNVAKPTRGRSMSMQDYDIPLRQRMNNTQMTVIDASPSSVDGDSATAGGGGGGGGAGTTVAATTTGKEQLVANWLYHEQRRHAEARWTVCRWVQLYWNLLYACSSQLALAVSACDNPATEPMSFPTAFRHLIAQLPVEYSCEGSFIYVPNKPQNVSSLR